MEITTNAIGHITGPLLWVLFLTAMAWYAVRGARTERREVASVRHLGESGLAPAGAGRQRRYPGLRREAVRGGLPRRRPHRSRADAPSRTPDVRAARH